jgi:hypothetical protein
MKLIRATALVLLGAIVVIVIAPSVDLEPTSLPARAEIVRLAVALTASVVTPLGLPAIEEWASTLSRNSVPSANLIVLDCVLRC